MKRMIPIFVALFAVVSFAAAPKPMSLSDVSKAVVSNPGESRALIGRQLSEKMYVGEVEKTDDGTITWTAGPMRVEGDGWAVLVIVRGAGRDMPKSMWENQVTGRIVKLDRVTYLGKIGTTPVDTYSMNIFLGEVTMAKP